MIELLEGENKKDGHVEPKASIRPLEKYVWDLVVFLYVAGWRVNSAERLEKVQRQTVKLRDAVSKNKEPVLLSFKKFPRMKQILFRRSKKLRSNSPYIFHRNGRRIKDFRAACRPNATERVGLTSVSRQNLCRSAPPIYRAPAFTNPSPVST